MRQLVDSGFVLRKSRWMNGLAGNKVPDKEPIQLDGLAEALRPGVDRAGSCQEDCEIDP